MAFRYSDVDPVFYDDDGNPCAGGSLTYTRTGTSTAHVVYSDSGLGTSLGNVITLDASGRAPDHWLDASTYAYRRVLKNAAGVAQGETRDNIREIDTAGVSIPDPAGGNDGEVVMVDGGAYVLYQVLAALLPDMTGHAGKQLGTDGALAFWEAKDEAPTYDFDNLPGGFEVSLGATWSLRIGGLLVQGGADTAPTASAISTSKAVTFGTAFSAEPFFIGVSPKATGVTNNSPSDHPSGTYTSPTASGFTANFFCGAENTGGTITITSTIPFTWLAVGPA
jgi:hypothetical protein